MKILAFIAKNYLVHFRTFGLKYTRRRNRIKVANVELAVAYKKWFGVSAYRSVASVLAGVIGRA